MVLKGLDAKTQAGSEQEYVEEKVSQGKRMSEEGGEHRKVSREPRGQGCVDAGRPGGWSCQAVLHICSPLSHDSALSPPFRLHKSSRSSKK